MSYPLLQGTQASSKPNTPKKKFQGKSKSKQINSADSKISAPGLDDGYAGGSPARLLKGFGQQGNSPREPIQPTTSTDFPDDVGGDESQASSPRRDAFIKGKKKFHGKHKGK